MATEANVGENFVFATRSNWISLCICVLFSSRPAGVLDREFRLSRPWS